MTGYIVNLKNEYHGVISFEKFCAIHNQIYRQGTGTLDEFVEKYDWPTTI